MTVPSPDVDDRTSRAREYKSHELSILLLLSNRRFRPRKSAPIRNFLSDAAVLHRRQPRVEHLTKLKADGVKAFLNLRQPGGTARRERAAAEQGRLKYFNIRVYTSPTSHRRIILRSPMTWHSRVHPLRPIRVGGF